MGDSDPDDLQQELLDTGEQKGNPMTTMYDLAREEYAALGIDTEAVMEKLAAKPISVHCWQGDDVLGFDQEGGLSGGIQTTMRNVGQAIGVAAIGAVLLFGITANIDNAMADSPVITPEVRTAVAERNISLMGDEQFEQTIADIPMTDEQRTELVQLNSDARIESTITSYVVSGVLILLGLFTTRWITIFKKDEDGKEETIVAETADEMPFEPVVDREM